MLVLTLVLIMTLVMILTLTLVAILILTLDTSTCTGTDTDTDADAYTVIDTDLQDFIGALLQNAEVLHHVALAHPLLAQQAAHCRRAAPCLLKHVADALLHPETHSHHDHTREMYG